ncbi:MAG: hypothetical protein U9P79_04590 [Candidatus Cloacimonadota bacterium]|nr:hypothetical protein [Candidatus Cloacimonadota bacterium]
MKKIRYSSIVGLLIIFALAITIMSCGRRGTIKTNIPPVITITNYCGITKPDTTMTDSTLADSIGLIVPSTFDSLFYQEIYWDAYDPDGVIISYAYRIGTWDSTNCTWQYDKSYGTQVDDEGWVIHRQSNGDWGRWTPENKRFPVARVYFPATDTTDYKKNFGKFEVMCIDNSGAISDIAKKYFISWSAPPTTSVSTSQGIISYKRVGEAIKFEFTVPSDPDPFGLGQEAAYYKYRLVYLKTTTTADTLDFSGDDIVDGIIDSTAWHTTENFPENFRDVLLLKSHYNVGENIYNKPELRTNHTYSDGSFEITRIQAKAVDKAGIVDADHADMSFFVRGYFYPETMPYLIQEHSGIPDSLGGGKAIMNILPHIYILGSNYYVTYPRINEVIPSKVLSSGVRHYGNQFCVDVDSSLTAIWSNDIAVHIRWEYLGQYGFDVDRQKYFSGGTFYYEADRDKYVKYYCDVEYIDIQVDGDVNGLPPIGEVITDNGYSWMRVPIESDQSCKLMGIGPGEHSFKVRAVDLAGSVGTTAVELAFNLLEPTPRESKEGILVIDDTYRNMIYAPDDSVTNYYNNLFGNYDNTGHFDLYSDSLSIIKNLNTMVRQASLPPYFSQTDIEKYKLVFWHSNNPQKDFNSLQTHLKNHYDILMRYVENGGNVCFTGTSNIRDASGSNVPFLTEYGGLLADTVSVFTWGTVPDSSNSPLKESIGLDGFAGINLDTFNTVFSFPNGNSFPEYWMAQPLGSIAGVTFLKLDNADPVFKGITNGLPEFDSYNDTAIASKFTLNDFTHDCGSVYIFGMPLFYFDFEQTHAVIEQIRTELGF